ncbi:acyl-CoA dehydrogenase family protein [Xanthobacter dioxanivorans]|uniref:Acyl-CoA dehydrogenase family protein n=1 Tax=Xanthobacter dioxanivorans TaxID=2528964 RepID=A0A974SKP1_9HYPH|nr:acyl-CoA dehydrogenase family protein [Xanthobacter dioxanivorans]QRG09040.1 acyl-CoA dehydrogenase family protein [Xanthobacter dioxanivorans]
MNFDLSEEQQLLKDSVARTFAKSYDFEARARILASPAGWSRAAWMQMAELGLLGLPFAPEDGGFGGGPVETMIVMEAIGRALVVEPYLSTAVLAAAVLRHGGSPALRARLVPQVADGCLILAFAHGEPQARWELSDVATSAERVEGGYLLCGRKSVVVGGDVADMLIVSGRMSGPPRHPTGLGLFLVNGSAPGVTIKAYATQDGRRAADIRLDSVFVADVDVVGDPAGALPVIARAVDEAIAAICAEAVGAMDEAVAMTVEYLKTRQQFGVAIGTFQALQHRAADMFVALEQARSMALFAVMSVAEKNPQTRAIAMSAAKIQIARSARFIGEQAIQLHGGIGMTMEYKVGHLFKRLVMIDKEFGDLDHHLDRLAAGTSLLEEA